MTIVPRQVDVEEKINAIRLARYAQIIRYDERRFWGLAVGIPSSWCRTIWTLPQRLMLARYLTDAQIEMEGIIGYPVGYRWIVEPRRAFNWSKRADYAWVLEGGVKAITTVSAGTAVNHGTDPAVIGPVAYAFTDVDEIHIFHPGTDIEIDPDTVSIAGGAVTITIPRARLVSVANADNPEAGWSYTDLSKFEATVDIKWIYNDPSTQAVLTTNHKCSSTCSTCGCVDYTYTGCIEVAQPEPGLVEVYPADYVSGAWTRKTTCNVCYRWMQLNYKAGKLPNEQMEDAIVRLAHSKMPVDPCGCDPAKSLWQRDRNVPTVLTAERLNCPFGLSDGAWFAYQQALSMAVTRGGGEF